MAEEQPSASRCNNMSVKIQDACEALHRKPNNANLLLSRAILYRECGEYTKALEDTNKAQKQSGDSYEVWAIRHDVYIGMGDLIKAESALEKAVRFQPSNYHVLEHLGHLNYVMHNYDKSRALYAQCMQLNPLELRYQAAVAHIELETGNYTSCLKILNTALTNNNEWEHGFLLRALCLSQMNMHDMALKDLSYALTINPSYANAYYCRAVQFHDYFNQPERALQDYTKCIALEKKCANAYLNRGCVYKEYHKDFVRALQDFNTCLKHNPKDYKAYLNRANLFIEIKDTDNAIADLSQAISLKPDCKYAIRNLELAQRINKMRDH